MSRKSKKDVIPQASPHTIKKFELIESYVKPWAQKLMLNESCNTLVFMDCMCNSGIYRSSNGQFVEGTPVRVAKALLDVARRYPHKNIQIFFNDIDNARVEELKKHLPPDERNFQIITHNGDANEFLKTVGPQLYQTEHLHYFLLYDPYDASINWSALLPFFRNWGEVLINHMVSDPIRAITTAKRQVTKEKYENTYLMDFPDLVPFGSNREAYENRVKEIIKKQKGNRSYYVSAFPFYNTQNSQVYSLVHCTSNREGFKLYKKCAWKVFGGQSSTKHMHDDPYQLMINLDTDTPASLTVATDESCFNVSDIAKYLNNEFSQRKNVPLDELWDLLDAHPIFPSEGYRKEIKKELTEMYGAIQETRNNPRTGKREILFSFK